MALFIAIREGPDVLERFIIHRKEHLRKLRFLRFWFARYKENCFNVIAFCTNVVLRGEYVYFYGG